MRIERKSDRDRSMELSSSGFDRRYRTDGHSRSNHLLNKFIGQALSLKIKQIETELATKIIKANIKMTAMSTVLEGKV